MIPWLLSLALLVSGAAPAMAERVVPRKNVINLSTGFYRFSTTGGSYGALGMIQAGYRRSLVNRVSLEGQLEHGITPSSNLASVFWGLDIGASYAFWNAMKTVSATEDVVTIDDEGPFGIFGSAGIAIKMVPLSQVTLSYTGPYLALVPVYRLSDSVQLQGRLQQGWIRNSGAAIQAFTATLGVGFQF
jgi:hypothetical protein